MKKVIVIFFLISLGFTSIAQSKIEIPEGKALVYFIRPTPYALLAKVKIFCDGKYIGATRGMTYIYTFVEPGKHSFSTKELQKADFEHSFEAGKVYYVEHMIFPGAFLIKRSDFMVLFDEDEAKELLKNNSLSRNQVE